MAEPISDISKSSDGTSFNYASTCLQLWMDYRSSYEDVYQPAGYCICKSAEQQEGWLYLTHQVKGLEELAIEQQTEKGVLFMQSESLSQSDLARSKKSACRVLSACSVLVCAGFL